MKAVHFGAGNIGRGFIGKVLADNQIEVTFADVNQEVVEQLKQRHAYPVKVVGSELKVEQVTGVSAVNSSTETEALLDLIAEVDLITTAVGPVVLDIIAGTIASGLERRFAGGNKNPLNIIAAENMVRGTTHLKEEVLKHLPAELHSQMDAQVGFVDSAVDRIVPPASAEVTDPLEVTVEEFSEWIVDETQFVGEIPAIDGMQRTDNLMAFVERKLFTLNTGHIVTAYLGYLAGHKTVREAIQDEKISEQVRCAMVESGEVLVHRYDFDREVHAKYIDKILGRFANPYLVDEVDRVGRQPLRKLGPADRLTKPVLGTLEYGLENKCLVKGIAAALCYKNDEDPQAKELQQMIAEKGVASALETATGFAPDSDISKRVIAQYQQLQQ